MLEGLSLAYLQGEVIQIRTLQSSERKNKFLYHVAYLYIFDTVGSPEKNLIPYDVLLPKNNIDVIIDEVTDIDNPSWTLLK